MRLKDKVVLVTGAARNIGQVYAVGLAREGAKVVASDVLDCADTVSQIEAAGGEALGLQVDVSDAEATRRMAASAKERFGRIDGLVNNAAIFGGLALKPFYELTTAEWDRMMAVNLRGMFNCCVAVFPYMREQNYGRIVNVSSNTVYRGVVGFLHYVTSKSGVLGFTRSLARECGPFGINVNTVAPDYIPHSDNDRGESHDLAIQKQRAIQRSQKPEDVLGTVVFLLSPDADFITGQTILVNGGIFMQ
jgi:NAD(P)-dependent dehydrogenase (short-subunit alcohol dehydrogenase family)